MQPRRRHVLVLGIGGAGLIRTLADDPDIETIYAVDWSYELPGLLSTGRAADILRDVLSSSKVTVVRTDARVAVRIFPPGSFDLIFDNLAFPSWAGAPSINSRTYFESVSRLLSPGGVFVRGANFSSTENRLGVLAGLVDVFPMVLEHKRGEVVMAGAELTIPEDQRLLEIMLPRVGDLNLTNRSPKQLLAWLQGGFRNITSDNLGGASPIRDDLLVHEYYWKPGLATR